MFVSPCTGFTSTLITADAPKLGAGKFLKVTTLVSPALMKSIVAL